MAGWMDALLDVICHRGGYYSDVLPLCLRCSGVHAGILCGIVLEFFVGYVLKRGPSRPGMWLGGLGFAVMAAVGFGGLHGIIAVSFGLKLFVALWFGASVSFFACAAIGHELAGSEARGRTAPAWSALLARGILLLLFALLSVAVQYDSAAAVRLLSRLALIGILAGFFTVNAALALVLLRAVSRPRRRLCFSLLLIPFFITAELTLAALWRRL